MPRYADRFRNHEITLRPKGDPLFICKRVNLSNRLIAYYGVKRGGRTLDQLKEANATLTDLIKMGRECRPRQSAGGPSIYDMCLQLYSEAGGAGAGESQFFTMMYRCYFYDI